MHPLGMALGLAYLAGGLVGRAVAARRGVSVTGWWWTVVALMAATVAGARLGYVIPNAGYYLQNLSEVWRPPIEGLSFTGGLLAGAACLLVASRRLGVRLWSLLDIAALSYLAGSIAAGAVWRTPVSAGVADPVWIALLDGAYISGVYALLWRLWANERGYRRVGAAALACIAGDALLRLGLGAVRAMLLGEAGPLWPRLSAVALLLAACILLAARALRSRPPGGLKPFHRPLSRWVGWFFVYGLLIAALALVRL